MRVISLTSKNHAEVAKEAIVALARGKVVACPTDTVYGLIADATNKKAVRKVFLIKGRQEGKPLPIFVKDIAMAKTLAKVSALQAKYMKMVWPGKVTLVLQSKGKLPKETGTNTTIGLRIPNHKLVRMILQKANVPLTGTSANLSGQPPISDSREILRRFQGRKHAPDILIDASVLRPSKPSKIVDSTGAKPRILRR